MEENNAKIRYVLPIQSISVLISVLASLADGIMINTFLGDAAQAAYGLTTPVILLNTALCGGVSSGLQVLTGRSIGKYKSAGLKEIYTTGVICGVGSVLLIVIPIALFSEKTAVLLGAINEEMIRLTAEYLRYIVLSFPLVMMMFILPPFLVFYGKKTITTWSAVILFVSDLCFNYINVRFVNGGMKGMAIASLLSYLLCIGYFVVRKNMTTENMLTLHVRSFSWQVAKGMLKYGILYFVYKICTVAMSFAMNRVLSHTGMVSYLTANAVLSTISMVTESFTSASNITTNMLCSYWLGKKDGEGFSRFRRDMLRTSLLMHIIIAVICMGLSGSLVGFFHVQSKTAFDLARTALFLFSLSLPFNAVNGIFRSMDLCMEKMKSAYLMTVFNYFIMPFSAMMILVLITDVKYVWAAYVIGQGLTALVTVWRRKKRLYAEISEIQQK